jgi:putative acetyltransferase
MTQQAGAPGRLNDWRIIPVFESRRLAELADLWTASWQAVMPHINFDSRRAWLCERIGELHGAGAETACAVTARGTAIGFVTFNRHSHYLDQLAVAPSRLGTGLAKALLDFAKLQSPQGLALHVNQDNFRAVRFYEREQFVRGPEAINPRSGLKIWSMTWVGEPYTAARTPFIAAAPD